MVAYRYNFRFECNVRPNWQVLRLADASESPYSYFQLNKPQLFFEKLHGVQLLKK
jgi:hypothetical protein